jgi:hypothetical protein
MPSTPPREAAKRCDRKGCPYCSTVTPERYRDERGDVEPGYSTAYGYREWSDLDEA